MTQKKQKEAPAVETKAEGPTTPQPPHVRKTAWRNPTHQTLTLRLFHGLGGHGEKFLIVKIPPGETVEIDSQYDDAIRPTREHMTFGGLGPQLQRLS